MKTKVTALFLTLVIAASGMGFATEVMVSVGEDLLDDSDLMVYENGMVYASVSGFAERIGADVDWYASAALAVVHKAGNYVSFSPDTDTVLVNNAVYAMPGKTVIKQKRLYAPLETLTTYFGLVYTYDETLKHVTFEPSALIYAPEEVRQVMSYTEEDLLWLARIVDYEARDGNVDKKTAVANVVLNRVEADTFPDSVYEVIYQRGQFPPAYYDSFATSTPRESSFAAAKRAFSGVEVAPDCYYFNLRPFPGKADDFYKNIQGDYFYR